MHFVTNLQPCLTIAFEVLRPRDAAGVLQMQRYLRCVCPNLPADYMRTVQHVVKELLEWAKVGLGSSRSSTIGSSDMS
jgi:hypothetical protein